MFLFSGAKIRCFLLPRSGFPLKGWGKIPTSLFCACGVLYIKGIEPEWSVKVCVKFFAVFGTIKRNIYYLCTQKKQSDE